MRARLFSVVILLPIVLVLLLLGGWFYRLFIAALVVIGAFEYRGMLRESHPRASGVLVALAGLTWHVDVWLGDRQIQALAFAGAVLLTTVWALYRYRAAASSTSNETASMTVAWALVLAGGIYLGVGSSYLLRLRALPLGAGWTLITLFLVWIGDTAAYFVGRAWGDHKIAPAISPGKSWEGYAAQITSSMLSGGAMVALWSLVARTSVGVEVWQGVALGALVSVFCPFGDFFISMIKREAGVKDTSRLIPGHGGVLDRLDTPLWAGILAFVFLTLVG